MSVCTDLGRMSEISRLSMGDDAEPLTSGAPELDSQGIVAVDITDKFFTATRGD